MFRHLLQRGSSSVAQRVAQRTSTMRNTFALVASMAIRRPVGLHDNTPTGRMLERQFVDRSKNADDGTNPFKEMQRREGRSVHHCGGEKGSAFKNSRTLHSQFRGKTSKVSKDLAQFIGVEAEDGSTRLSDEQVIRMKHPSYAKAADDYENRKHLAADFDDAGGYYCVATSKELPANCYTYEAIKSASTPGGQAANTGANKAELRVDLAALVRAGFIDSIVLDNCRVTYPTKVNRDDVMIFRSIDSRSLLDNKKTCMTMAMQALRRSSYVPPVVRPPMPKKKSKYDKSKKRQAVKARGRRAMRDAMR